MLGTWALGQGCRWVMAVVLLFHQCPPCAGSVCGGACTLVVRETRSDRDASLTPPCQSVV